MNDMIAKSVDVLGSDIVAAKDSEGNIWAGVSHFCKALGMTNKQRDNQVAKVQTDKTLRKGTLKFREGVFDPMNEVIAIKVDFIPLWLAKIQITDRMEQDHPGLADKLLKYQLQAKDILAAAFLPTENKQSPSSGGTPIRLYKNNKWYILTIGDEVYNLAPDEAKIISKAVSAMLKNGVAQIEGVVRTMVESFGRDCELKCARECIVGIDKAALEDKARGKGGDGDE